MISMTIADIALAIDARIHEISPDQTITENAVID